MALDPFVGSAAALQTLVQATVERLRVVGGSAWNGEWTLFRAPEFPAPETLARLSATLHAAGDRFLAGGEVKRIRPETEALPYAEKFCAVPADPSTWEEMQADTRKTTLALPRLDTVSTLFGPAALRKLHPRSAHMLAPALREGYAAAAAAFAEALQAFRYRPATFCVGYDAERRQTVENGTARENPDNHDGIMPPERFGDATYSGDRRPETLASTGYRRTEYPGDPEGGVDPETQIERWTLLSTIYAANPCDIKADLYLLVDAIEDVDDGPNVAGHQKRGRASAPVELPGSVVSRLGEWKYFGTIQPHRVVGVVRPYRASQVPLPDIDESLATVTEVPAGTITEGSGRYVLWGVLDYGPHFRFVPAGPRDDCWGAEWMYEQDYAEYLLNLPRTT